MCCVVFFNVQCTNHFRSVPKSVNRRFIRLLPGAELEDLQEGDVFEGTVTNVGRYGVFVDVGAAPWPKSAERHTEMVVLNRYKWWVSGGKEATEDPNSTYVWVKQSLTGFLEIWVDEFLYLTKMEFLMKSSLVGLTNKHIIFSS